MTAETINAAVKRYWFFIYVALTPFIVLMIFNTQLSRWLTALLHGIGVGVKAPTVALVLIAVEVVLVFVAIFAAQKVVLPRCSACRKVISPNASGIVIASKNCPNCGAQVIHVGKP